MRALALGSFDGVHRGHQVLLAATVAAAGRAQLTPAALVIHDAVLRQQGEGHPPMLLASARHEQALRDAGIAEIAHLELDAAARLLTPEQFVAQLGERWRARVVLAGENFRFGRGRTGDAAALRRLGAAAGLTMEIVPLLLVDGLPVSSTRVRQLIMAGELAAAAELLGRPPEVTGTVVRGAGRGRELGFPTANLDCPDAVLPPPGIYLAAVAGIAGAAWALLSYGRRPTFAQDTRGALVEAHLLDWQGDLYGRVLTVLPVAWLREERQYEIISELIGQMRADARQARELTTTYAVARVLRRATG